MLLVIEHEKRCRDGFVPMTTELRAIEIDASLTAVIDLAAAVRKVLDDRTFTEGAGAMAAEIAALPDIAECLPLLEQLAGMRVSADE